MEASLEKFIFYFNNFWDYSRNILDIIIVAYIFYWIYRFFVNSKAMQLLKGVVIIFIIAVLSDFLRLDTLDWLIKNMTSALVITVVVLFQPELRRIITHFGQRSWFATDLDSDSFPLDELVNSVVSMSHEKIGSLIVIERNTALKLFIDSGVVVDALISEEFIKTVFYPTTPLHDGAIIIRDGKIAAASCYLPLSDSKILKKHHGARHRAALGIAEETDALVLISSEETGGIHIMVNGKMLKIKESDLKNAVLFFLNPKTANEEEFKIA